MTQPPVYVAMIGEFPTGVALTLEAAQDQVLTNQTRFQEAGKYEHRWDDKQRPGEVWRLMERRSVPGARFAWTCRSVHEAPQIAP